MTGEIRRLVSASATVAEICTGAYGYLSSAVDNFLHSEGGDQDELHRQFHELQVEVTRGLQRVFDEKGMSLSEVASAVREVSEAADIPPGEVDVVVRKALKLVYPPTPVTET